jgi:uncharacterized membrane protein
MKIKFNEKLIIIVITFFLGLILTIFIPPFSKPDEPVHFLKTVEVSHGKIFCKNGDRFNENYDHSYLFDSAKKYGLASSPYTIPPSLFKVSIFNKQNNYYKESITKYCNIPSVGYLFLALGYKFGTLINLHPLITFYLGRLINFLVIYLVLAFIAYKSKEYFWIFFIPLTLPQTLHQISSYSYDSVLILFCFISLYLFLSKPSTFNGIFYFLSILISLITKYFAYTPFCLFLSIAYIVKNKILFFNKKRKIDNVKNFILFSLIGLIIVFYLYLKFKPLFFENSNLIFNSIISPSIQLKIMFDNPHLIFNLPLKSLWEKQIFFIKSTIGNLEWLDFQLYWIIYFIYFAIFLVLIYSFSNKKDFIKLPSFILILFVLLIIFQTYALFIIMYLTWTPLGSEFVEGVQGRYFIPYLPIIIITLISLVKYLEKFKLLKIITFMLISITIIINIYKRHYDYSKAIRFDKTYQILNTKKIFNNKNNKLAVKVNIEKEKKIAAIYLNIEKTNKQIDFIEHPPLYIDIFKDNSCDGKKLRRIIVQANSLKQGENTLFLKPIKTNFESVCIKMSTPVNKFSQIISFREIIDKQTRVKTIFMPQYLW